MRSTLSPANTLVAVILGIAIATPAFAGGIQFGPPGSNEPVKQQRKKVKRKPAPPPIDEEPLEVIGTEPAEEAELTETAAPAATAATPQKKTWKTRGLPPPPAPRNCKTKGTFSGWLAKFRKEALAEGISRRAVNSGLAGLTVDPKIIRRDRRQGFFSKSFLEFSSKLATKNRIYSGRRQIKRNKRSFARVGKEFGVPASVITGFWALESDFGALGKGKYRILRSIATLAYDCRRGPMFRDELKAALMIIDRGDMSADEMLGSWAGEIGQTQFLPTRFLDHGLDYNRDGQVDLYENNTDIIGTTANYMTHLGWRRGEPWLQEVRVPRKLPWDQADLAIKHPRSQWAKWGVRNRDGSALDPDSMPASLVLPMGRFGPAFLAYQNFHVYLQWNQSLNYAITAAYLATRIDGAPTMNRGQPGIPFLGPQETKELQRRLVRRGFDVGDIDGIVGEKTRKAIKTMQIKFKMPADSYPTPALLNRLRGR